jgi:mannose-1-phosphate guanylyltransferase/mannose-6-phosphate isomerase
MCGGRSLRLWPLSEYKSKNFIDIFGFSPLELTIKRFLKITPRQNIFLVANFNEKKSLSQIKLINKENIFFEPESKNTAAAILLSVFKLRQRFGENRTMIVSPVDHLIKGKGFGRAMEKSFRAAEQGFICTLGIAPDKPTPNFGYIQLGKKEGEGLFRVKRFIEKPSLAEAVKLIKKGDTFFNSGMFIATLKSFNREFKEYYPFYLEFFRVFNCSRAGDNEIGRLYKGIADVPFDKAVMEKTKLACVVKDSFYWKDFGSWQAVAEVLPKDARRNVRKGDVFCCDSSDNFIHLDDPKKKVLALGIKDIFYIEAKDYVLLANREYIDNIKAALREFKSNRKR